MASKETKKTEAVDAVVDEVKEVAAEIDKDAEIAKLRAELERLQDEKDALNEQITSKAMEIAEAEPEPVDPWEEYLEVIVPRKPRGAEQYYYVCVNDRSCQIPADGKMQRMRKPFAEVLLMSLEAEAEADRFAENIPHEAAPEGYESLMKTINELKMKLARAGIN